jgi:hypothetical protein
MVNQLFYSQDTRIKVEQELKKLVNEPNPFQNAHISKWGQVREKRETIGEVIERWNETLADSNLVKGLYDDFKRKYIQEIEKGSTKEPLISKQIRSSSKFRLNDDELPKKSFDGFRNKGFRWYEEGKNFSLKDFILYHPETISENVFEEVQLVTVYEIPTQDLIQTLVKWAPKNELFFCDACEGYAAAKYVAFLKNELEDLNKKKTVSAKSAKIKKSPHFKLKDNKPATKKLVTNLYRKLKKKGFINTSITQFNSIFDLSTYTEPVIWSSGNTTELLYFYFKLEDSKLIEVPTTKFKILKYFFAKEGNIPFEENFKQLYQRIKNDFVSPARSQEIDNCFL